MNGRRNGRATETVVQTARVLAMIASTLVLGPGSVLAYVIGPPLEGDPIVVSAAPDEQIFARVSGDWVVYTNFLGFDREIRYHDLATGADRAIPVFEGDDFLADIDGTTVVFEHWLSSDNARIYAFDVATGGPAVELDPQPRAARETPSIGGGTVAWTDWALRWPNPDVVAYDLLTGVATPLTHDLTNIDPQVSPDGDTVVWTRCRRGLGDCDVWQAHRVEGVWQTGPLAADPEVDERRPVTDGRVAFYVRGFNPGDIGWIPLSGGTSHSLGIPVPCGYPSISGPLVAFHCLASSGDRNEVWLYDLDRDTLRQATSESVNAVLPDLFVAADGSARLVWTQSSPGSDYDIFALDFEVPRISPVEALGELRDLVLGLDLSFGISTSLVAKLEAATTALGTGDLASACSLLGDFVSEVRAQSGKRLTSEQAVTLEAAAGEIRSALGC